MPHANSIMLNDKLCKYSTVLFIRAHVTGLVNKRLTCSVMFIKVNVM